MPEKKNKTILPYYHEHKPDTSEQEAPGSSSSNMKSKGKHKHHHHKTHVPAEAGSSHEMETRSNDSMKGSSQGYYSARSRTSSPGYDYVQVKTTPSPTSSDNYVEVKDPWVAAAEREKGNRKDNAKIDALDGAFPPSVPTRRKKEKKAEKKKE